MSLENLKNTTKLVDDIDDNDDNDDNDIRDLKNINSIFATNNFYIDISSFKNAGLGVFAKTHIKDNKKLGEYLGNKITEDEATELKCQEYIFEVYDKIKGNFFFECIRFKIK